MAKIERLSAVEAHKTEAARKTRTAKPRAEKKTGKTVPKDKFSKGKRAGVLGKIKSFWAENITGSTGKGIKAAAQGMDFGTKAAIAGGAIGATAGGLVGYQAGKLEAARAENFKVSWQEPVMERKHLGNIPHDRYSWFGWWGHGGRVVYDESGSGMVGGRAIYRDAPVYNPDGTIKMKTVEADISSQRFGPVTGAIFGSILGAIGGMAGGIAVGLLHRISRG